MAWTDGNGVVLIQWATATANDSVPYTFLNMSDVRATPKKPVPSDSPLIDDEPGWIAALTIQGVTLTADHIGFDLDGQGRLVVGKWNDDAADWPPFAGSGFGWLYTFDALDPVTGQPRQTVTKYADTTVLQAALDYDTANGTNDYVWCQRWLDDPTVQPWAQFPENIGGGFGKNNTIHGVWLSDEQMAALNAARTPHGYRDPVWKAGG